MGAWEWVDEPPALPGQFVRLVGETTGNKFYKVTWIEQLPGIVHNFGTVSANSTSSEKEIDNLYMRDGELGAYTIDVLDDFELEVWQPGGMKRFMVKNTSHKINPLTPKRLRKIYVWEDNKVKFYVHNNNDYALPKSEIFIYGWRMKLEEVKERPEKWTDIVIEGMR